MCVRTADLVVLALLVVCTWSYTEAVKSDLMQFLRERQMMQPQQKRKGGGNPCPNAEKPFPCKMTDTCIPFGYICDDNVDCEDGFDEDSDMCTAAHRPPVEEIMHFVTSEQGWLIPNIFGGKNTGKIAHALAVSHTLEDFRRRANLTPKEMRNLRHALEAVRNGDEMAMEDLGMPSSAWNEVEYFFNKLIKSGFDN